MCALNRTSLDAAATCDCLYSALSSIETQLAIYPHCDELRFTHTVLRDMRAKSCLVDRADCAELYLGVSLTLAGCSHLPLPQERCACTSKHADALPAWNVPNSSSCPLFHEYKMATGCSWHCPQDCAWGRLPPLRLFASSRSIPAPCPSAQARTPSLRSTATLRSGPRATSASSPAARGASPGTKAASASAGAPRGTCTTAVVAFPTVPGRRSRRNRSCACSPATPSSSVSRVKEEASAARCRQWPAERFVLFPNVPEPGLPEAML